MTTTTFNPAAIDATDWPQVEALLAELRDRPIATAAAFERWLIDRGELEAAVDEAEANLYIAMTCDTEDKAKDAAYTRFVETIPPRLKPVLFELDTRQAQLHERFALDRQRYHVLERSTRAQVELFRDENVPIQTELEKLSQRYQKIAGAMTVQFDGKERTLPQMAVYQESTDRAVREGAWRAVAERRLRDAEAIDEVYDLQVGLRHRMGVNAGFPNFVGYAFKSKQRFDYTPEDCFRFHEAIERAVVPVVRRNDARRRERLGVPSLRPWDLAVDTKGRGPLKPFSGGAELMAKSLEAVGRLDPRLREMLGTLGDGTNTRGSENGACLDLDSRKGKAPGGYQYQRELSRTPFIFMNAAGVQQDVETMVHEAGHAFHAILAKDDPIKSYRGSPLEFAEVASMAMELLTMPHWGGARGFYPDAGDLARAQRKHLEGIVNIMPWIATIDAFQHWVYTRPTHTREERRAHWLELDGRFGRAVSWEGLDRARQHTWQRQGHLFGHAFYYIEYGIAQLGALQLWVMALERGERTAIDHYMKGLRLGGSRPLPELFRASGLEFDFGLATLQRLMDRIERELEKLPD